MTVFENRPIAIFYEHPDWFRPLFAELDRRGVDYVKIDANAHTYDPAETEVRYSLVFNRASPSAYLRRPYVDELRATVRIFVSGFVEKLNVKHARSVTSS